ncbi:MAG TPA: helix-turn-helix domain-containing protein, partial [Ktedonobacterales bacterium]
SGEVVVGPPANDEALSPRLERVLVELMIQQALIVSQLPNRHELKNKFIHDLLRGQVWDETAILREGQILGLDLTHPRAVILIDASGYILGSDDSRAVEPSEVTDARAQRRAQLVIATVVSFFDLQNDTICAYIGDGEVAVLKASSTRDLVKWADSVDDGNDGCASWANLVALKRAAGALLGRLRHDTRASISIGIGRYHPSIRGLALSYQDARAALSLGRRFHGQNEVHCLDRLGVASFIGVSDERIKIDLALHLLSPLDHEDELLDTLRAFFAENCSVSATSARLSIHRNTLSYRLDKISSLTGLDPRTFDHAVQIRIALLLREM